MEVTAIELYPLDKGKLKGSGWVTLDNQVEVKVAIFTSSQGGVFASLPSQRVPQDDGTTKYYPEVRMQDETKKKVDEMVTTWYNEGRKAPAKKAPKPNSTPAGGVEGMGDFPADW